MKVRFTVEADLNFVSGKFAAKDEVAEELSAELEAGDPGSVFADEAEYDVVDWTVTWEEGA